MDGTAQRARAAAAPEASAHYGGAQHANRAASIVWAQLANRKLPFAPRVEMENYCDDWDTCRSCTGSGCCAHLGQVRSRSVELDEVTGGYAHGGNGGNWLTQFSYKDARQGT